MSKEKSNFFYWSSVKTLKFKTLNNLTLIEGWKKRRDSPEEFKKISTGFKKLDKFIGGGLKKGQIYVVAAAPHNGKTTFLINLTHSITQQKKLVLFFSLETDREQYIQKFLSVSLEISYKKMLEAENRKDAISVEEMNKCREHFNRKIPLIVCDKEEMNYPEIEDFITTRAEKRKEENLIPIEVIMIDYIQNISTSEESPFKQARHLELRACCKMLKRIAKKLNICVVVSAQMKADGMKLSNSGKYTNKPNLNMVKECTFIGECAQGFFILHREKRMENDFKLIIEKNRQGEMGEISFSLDGDSGGFRES